MKVTVSRKAHFNAAHRLHNPNWDNHKNTQVFGKCNNEHFHGHNYELIVHVTGNINPETGYVMDMKELAEIIYQEVEIPFDHKNLNIEVPEFASLIPSAENISVVIYEKIKKRLSPDMDLAIELYETPRNFVRYDGK